MTRETFVFIWAGRKIEKELVVTVEEIKTAQNKK